MAYRKTLFLPGNWPPEDDLAFLKAKPLEGSRNRFHWTYLDGIFGRAYSLHILKEYARSARNLVGPLALLGFLGDVWQVKDFGTEISERRALLEMVEICMLKTLRLRSELGKRWPPEHGHIIHRSSF